MKRVPVVVAIAVLAVSACGSDSSSETAATAAEDASSASEPATEAPATTTAPTEAPTTTAVSVGPAALDASPWVLTFGDVSQVSIPDGEPGEVSVVAWGSKVDASSSLSVVVRNNTSEPVGVIEVSATARDADGALAGSGSSQGLQPAIVAPGEIAFGYVFFGADVEGASFTYDFTVDAQEVDTYEVPVKVSEINVTNDQIVGLVLNDTDEKVTGPIDVMALCFDAAGAITDTLSSYTDQDDVAPGKTGSFSLYLYEDGSCLAGIVGASGYSY